MLKSVVSILSYSCLMMAGTAIASPRLRPSPYFGSITGIEYLDVKDLGTHNYERALGERNPLIYTAKAGFIDMGHLRESADRARYLFELCQANMLECSQRFSYRVIEPAIYELTIEYPPDWNQLPTAQRESIAREVSIALGQHLAQMSTIWHEIVTWYGFSSVGLLSEQPSSFSWEDTYSDLLGSKLAAKVLRENILPYNEAMTEMIDRELSKLLPLSAATAHEATLAIDGKWFVGVYPFLKMNKRNFDVGFDDGAITPFRVPGIGTDTEIRVCEVPALDCLDQYGFSISLTMTPHEIERVHIFPIISTDPATKTLKPHRDFPKIIDHIHQEAIAQNGPDVDKPTL